MKLLLLIILLLAFRAIPEAHEATKLFYKDYYGYVFNEYDGTSYLKGGKARAYFRYCEKQIERRGK